jgi:hypothetical protein
MKLLFTQASAIFFFIGFVSMLIHAVKKWVYGEIRGGLMNWYLRHPRATVSAVLACLGGIATLILTGVIVDPNDGAQVMAAFGAGYAADTLNNQGKS